MAALALRALVALLPLSPAWDGAVYERAAASLAGGHGYTQRSLRPGAPLLPTAFYPVGWPAVLAVPRALGAGSRFDLGLQALLGALAVPLAARIGRRVGGSRAARLTAWAVALWPGGVLAGASWMGEPLFTFAILMATLPLAHARRKLFLRIVVSGALFGLAAYVRPTALVIAPLLAFVVALGPARPRLGRALAAATLMVAISTAPSIPWALRNQERLGALALSSNGGANLLIGTLSGRFTPLDPSADCRPGTRELVRDRCRRERALERIARDPARWIGLGALKLGHTFGYETTPALQLGVSLGVGERAPPVLALAALCTLGYWVVTGLALLGARRLSRRALGLTFAPAAGVALLHLVFLGGDRYHLPVVPFLAVVAASMIAGGIANRRARRLSSLAAAPRDRRPRPRAWSA